MAVNINVPSQVKTYANLAAFPATGALKTIYIAEDTNKTYRWTGSVYTEISASAAMTWGAIGGTLSNQTDLQSALDAKVPTSRTLTINGVTQDLSADRTFAISTGITIGTTAITSGTVGRVLFQGTGNVVQQSSSLFWDATNNRLGIGTNSPLSDIDISKNVGSNGSVWIRARNTNSGGEAAISITNDLYYAAFELFGSTFGSGISNNALFTTQSGVAYLGFATLGAANIGFRTNGAAIGQERLTIFGSSGNVGIGTTTDAGFRLDVNGTARVQGNTTLASTFITASGAQLGVGTSSVNAYYRAGVSGNIGTTGLIVLSSDISGTGTPVYLERTASLFNVFSTLPIAFSVGSERMRIFSSTGNIGINTTTDAGFRLDVNGTARVSSNLTVSGTLVANLLRAANLNESMILYQRRTATSGDGFSLFDNNVVNGSNININILNIGGSYGTSGTCVHNNLLISREINLASGTQTVRGFYYNPTLTNTTGLTTHYAIHTAVGRIRFENLPTSSAGLSAGELWNDAGTLKIV